MITTLLLLIILGISLFLITFRVYSISILLGAITIFIIGSFILFQHNHVLIGSIFLVVYSGAILVFICISLLLSPAIRPQENDKNNSQILTTKGFRIFFLFFCILFFLVFLGSHLTNSNLTSDLIELNKFYEDVLDIETTTELIFLNNNICKMDHPKYYPIENEIFCEFLGKKIRLIPTETTEILILNPVIITFDKTFFNLNNAISVNFKDNFILIIMIGIYLLITLVCCLVLFSINHEKRVIKRQDSVDQILKRWI